MRRVLVMLMTASVAVVEMTGQQAVTGWLSVGADIRGRAEGYTGVSYTPDNNDAYYLHRLRLNLTATPCPWLTFFAQAQDAQAPAYPKPVPDTVADTLDLRQAYIELGSIDKGRWGLRVGRQELIFGEERLVGASNWSNVARTFDAARLSYSTAGVRLDWFASAVVVPINGVFDHPQTKTKLYGFYSSFDRLIKDSVFQPYVFWKAGVRVIGETGRSGDLDVYTYGLRAFGKLPRRFDYNLDVALQSGHAATDTIRAWTGHWVLGYSPWKSEKMPRLIYEYDYASGDANPADGHRGTFDQLYPTNHTKYGIADRLGWRNMRDSMGGMEWKPAPKWKLNLDDHVFWLNTTKDALYNASGTATVRNPLATSNRVGDELDLQVAYRFSPHLQLGFGYGHLFPGPFLKQSSKGSPVTFPYGMWEYKF